MNSKTLSLALLVSFFPYNQVKGNSMPNKHFVQAQKNASKVTKESQDAVEGIKTAGQGLKTAVTSTGAIVRDSVATVARGIVGTADKAERATIQAGKDTYNTSISAAQRAKETGKNVAHAISKKGHEVAETAKKGATTVKEKTVAATQAIKTTGGKSWTALKEKVSFKKNADVLHIEFNRINSTTGETKPQIVTDVTGFEINDECITVKGTVVDNKLIIETHAQDGVVEVHEVADISLNTKKIAVDYDEVSQRVSVTIPQK